jgi:hypothetical protein
MAGRPALLTRLGCAGREIEGQDRLAALHRHAAEHRAIGHDIASAAGAREGQGGQPQADRLLVARVDLAQVVRLYFFPPRIPIKFMTILVVVGL